MSFGKYIYTLLLIFVWSKIINAQNVNVNYQSLFEDSYYGSYKGFPPLKTYWLNLSNSNSISDLQPLSYGLDAILAMFETTDSISYIEDAIALTNNNIRKSRITNLIHGNKFTLKDSYKGWIENDSSSGVYHTETVLSEIYFYQYVCRLLKDIHGNKKIYYIRRFKDFYNKTLYFIENNIWDKWESRGLKYNNDKDYFLLLGRTHMASHWAYIASELYFLTKNETRKSNYLAFVNLYNSALENNFYKYDKYLSWNQTWKTSNDNGIIQDVSHANLVVSYIVEAYNLGLWQDSDAIRRIIATIKYKLWDGQDCLFRDNIDGTMFNIGYKGSVGSFQADGFVKLTQYDKSLFSIYRRFIGCSTYLTQWHQYGQLFANLALSQKLLITIPD